ncbi:MAG: hypothetical protein V3V06_04570 [Dehalococcoidia bacterium]
MKTPGVEASPRDFPPSTEGAKVRVLDLASGEVVTTFEGVRLAHPSPFSSDGSQLALVSSQGQYCEGPHSDRILIGAMDGAVRTTAAEVVLWTVERLQWSPDGRWLARGGPFVRLSLLPREGAASPSS